MNRICIAIILFFNCCFVSAKNLDFKDALDEILKRDTTIPPADEASNAARIQGLSKKLNFLPSVSVGHYRTKTYRMESETDNFSLKGKVNIFRFGADVASMQAADANFTASTWNIDEAVLTAEAKAVNVLLDNIEKFLRLEILEKMVAVKRSSLETTRLRYRKGLVASQEVQKIQVDLNNANARLRNMEVSYETSRANLIAILGHDDIEHAWPWKSFLGEKKYVNIIKDDFVISSRPDYKKAHAIVQSNEYKVKEIKRSFFPKIDFSYSYDFMDNRSMKAYERTAMLSITMPLFDNLSNYSSYRLQRASLVRSRYDLERIKRDVQTGWNLKRKVFGRIYETVISRDSTLKLSRKLYQDNFNRFQKGRITVNDLFVDQNRLLDSENLSVEGWGSIHRAFINLCHAKGMRINHCMGVLPIIETK
ncbi:MAG: TolC family protein [Bacteriovoracaceae bacterium]|nr:TolC family protein [Bacteriovoracaceae bacterium]